MKRILVFVIGICLFATAATATSPEVTYDGKMLHFPAGLNPVDFSSLTFDLEKVPNDKLFVIGKVFEFQFISRTGKFGAFRYAIFTKWGGGKIEIFWYPTFTQRSMSSQTSLTDKPFLDCVGSNDKYTCVVRGRDNPLFNTYELIFRGQKITIQATDRSDAEAKIVGEIPAPAKATQTNP